MPVWAIFVAVLGALGAVIAIRLRLNLDVNELLEQRRKHNKQKLKALCPHVEIVPLDGRIEVQSFFSRRSTGLYRCSQCGQMTDERTANRVTKYWAARGEAKYDKDRKAFLKHAKRMGLTS